MSATNLSRDAVLVRRPDLTIHVGPDGEVEILDEGARSFAGPHALAILDAFSEPRKVSEVIEELSARSARDFATLTATLLQLTASGVLSAPGAAPHVGDPGGFSGAGVHARMLHDTGRTDAFLAALIEVVKPSDVVVDIGTGTGVLALAAARAGARQVFAVEATSIADLAERMFRANGAGDRVELVRGWSSRISLSERATVMVSETVGNQALGENIIETTMDAHKRLLVPAARLIPSKIRIYARATATLAEVRARHVFSSANAATWSERYGIDFTPLTQGDEAGPIVGTLTPAEARSSRALAAPALIAEVDLASPEPMFERTADITFDTDGDLDAIEEYFELELSPSVRFDGHPDRVSEDCSWRYPVWMLPTPRRVRAGEKLRVSYRYAAGRGKLSLG